MTQAIPPLLFGKVLYDVSSFVREPNRTGIQRVTAQLGCQWPEKGELVPFMPLSNGRIALYDDSLLDIIDQWFRVLDDDLLATARVFHSAVTTCEASITLRDAAINPHFIVDAAAAMKNVRAIVNTELFFDDERIGFYEAAVQEFGEKIFFLICDFLPWLKPEYFFHFNPAQSPGLMRWIYLTRKLKYVAVISRQTEIDFINRILRTRRDCNVSVISLGSDAMGAMAPRGVPGRCVFVVLGSLEPRKKLHRIIEAFSQLPSECGAELHLLGKMIQYSPEEEQRLVTAISENPAITWEQGCADEEIREIICTARATLYLGVDEGYGLPPLESLALGVPVIVSRCLPALDQLPDHGQVRIDPDDVEAIATALRQFLDPEYALQKRQEISDLKLPTWREFAVAMRRWVFAAIDPRALSYPPKSMERGSLTRRVNLQWILRQSAGLPRDRLIVELFKAVCGRSPNVQELSYWLARAGLFNADGQRLQRLFMLNAAEHLSEDTRGISEAIDTFFVIDHGQNYLEHESIVPPRLHDDGRRKALATFCRIRDQIMNDDCDIILIFYQELLGRLPDIEGVNNWNNTFRSGASKLDVAIQISHSGECRNRMGSETSQLIMISLLRSFIPFYEVLTVDDANFIDALYRSLLKRHPDREGRALYAKNFAQGASRDWLLLSVILSSEYISKVTDVLSYRETIRWLSERCRTKLSPHLEAERRRLRLTRSGLAGLLTESKAKFEAAASWLLFGKDPRPEGALIQAPSLDPAGRLAFLETNLELLVTGAKGSDAKRLRSLLTWVRAARGIT